MYMHHLTVRHFRSFASRRSSPVETTAPSRKHPRPQMLQRVRLRRPQQPERPRMPRPRPRRPRLPARPDPPAAGPQRPRPAHPSRGPPALPELPDGPAPARRRLVRRGPRRAHAHGDRELDHARPDRHHDRRRHRGRRVSRRRLHAQGPAEGRRRRRRQSGCRLGRGAVAQRFLLPGRCGRDPAPAVRGRYWDVGRACGLRSFIAVSSHMVSSVLPTALELCFTTLRKSLI